MISDHPNPGALVAFARGELPPEVTVQLSLHVAACAVCRTHVDRSDAATSPANRPFGTAFERAATTARRSARRLAREERSPPDALSSLLGLSRKAQDEAIRSTAGLRTLRFTRQLLDTCRKTWSYDPRQAERMARLALIVTGHLSSRHHGRRPLADLRAEAWGSVGNCLRIRSELREASRALDRASDLLAEGTRALEETTPLASVRSSLLRDLGDSTGALSTLDEALHGARLLGDRHLEGRLLLGRAIVHTSNERSDAAIPLLERARELIDRQREDHLASAVEQNLALALDRVNEPARALDALARAEALFPRRRMPFERLRCAWARARILASHGRQDRAADLLALVSRRFAAAGLPYDAALADLDRAEIALALGEPEHCRALTAGALAVCARRQAEQGTQRALALFRLAGGMA